LIGKWAVGLALGPWILAQGIAAPQKVEGTRSRSRTAGARVARAIPKPRIIGTITYDTGANNAGFFPPTAGITVGNRFNSDMGGPLAMTNEITQLTFFPQAPTAYLTVFGPPNAGGTAPNLSTILLTGLAPGTFNYAFIGTPIPVGSDFLVGAWLNGGSVGIGMDNMTMSGQGFHAFQLVTNFPGPGTGFQAVPNRNALLRATLPPIPVELMNFSVQ
jgi:hypothetical protein